MTMRALSVVSEREFMGDTLSLFEQLAADGEECMLLESKDGNGVNNVQSLLFVKQALRIEARGQEVTFSARTENGEAALEALLPELEKRGRVARSEPSRVVSELPLPPRTGPDVERITAPSTADTIRLVTSGWELIPDNPSPIRVPGIFAYDYLDQFEDLPEARADRHGFPDFVFWLPEQMIVLEHTENRAYSVAYCYGESLSESQIGKSWKASVDLAARVGEADRFPRPTSDLPGVPTGALAQGEVRDAEPDLDDGEYASLVEKSKEHIVAGDVFQIVPSRTFRTPLRDPTRAYAELRRLNPSPYLFFVRGGDFILFGSSPETCISVKGDPKKVALHPIAGTRHRGRRPDGEVDVDLDNRLEAELKLDEKELAEHMMLVDLARNDVARISRAGTRQVAQLLEVDRYSHVMHLVSVVEGELREELDAIHAYLASMNMGTLVGAPKIEAARLLRRYEADKRGPYGGAVGYFTSAGDSDMAIVIRAGLVTDGTAHIRAGAGVVFDSDPRAEAEETRGKAGAVLQAIQRAERGRR
jgi:anthranilate synthase component 1